MTRLFSTIARFALPSLGSILWIAALIGVVGIGPRMMNVDGDLGRHLVIGRYILEHAQVPTTDLFSHTMAGAELTPHEWLAQVIFALADRWMGLDGVILLSGLVIATSFWLVYRRARQAAGGLLITVVFTILAMAAASLHWLSRPHIFTFLMLALWMTVLEGMRRGDVRRWWWMPVMMGIWANLHGAFIAGFVTWALFGLGLAWDWFWGRLPDDDPLPRHFWRYYGLGGGLAGLVTLINPAGPRLWATSLGYVGNHYLVGHTAEYLPPNFHDPSTWPFLLLIGLALVLFALPEKRLGAGQVFPAAAWLVMGLYSVRNVPLFVIVAAPALAKAASDWLAGNRVRLGILDKFWRLDARLRDTELRLRGWVWPVLVTVLLVAVFRLGVPLDFQQRGNGFDPQTFPTAAVDYLTTHPQPGRVFNYFPWGGYLLYRLWPDQRVFIDGQTDFYGEALTRQYEQVLTLAPGWQAVFDQYNIDWVLLPVNEPAVQAIRALPGWKIIYQDQISVILTAAPSD